MNVHPFKPIKKSSLSHQIEENIKRAIASGAYKPFEKLPSERDLMAQFNVSRTTVREALMSLQSSGLIFVKRGVNAGAYVSEINPDPITKNFQNLIKFGKINFMHLTEARLYVEPEATRIAAICRTDKDVQILSELLEKAEASNKTSPKEARLVNIRFHVEIAKVTQNPIIIFISESITQVFSSLIVEMTKTKISRADVAKNIDTHRFILEAMIQGDEREAYARAKAHILGVYDTYRRILPNIPQRDVSEFERRLRSIPDLGGRGPI